MIASTFVLLGACGHRSKQFSAVTQGQPEEFGLAIGQLAERVEETERSIAVCMQQAGFEYVALDFATVQKAMQSDKTAPGVSSDDYLRRFGLGITTQFDKPIVEFGAGQANNSVADSLSEPDRIAFRRTLWGEAPEWNHARALDDEDFSQTGGCTRLAAQKNYKPSELTGTYVNPADRLLDQDRRVLAATRQWSGCMRAKGFQFDTPQQVEDQLHERLATIVQGQDPRALVGPSLDALHDLQDVERALAARLAACEDRYIEPVRAKVEAELYGARTR